MDFFNNLMVTAAIRGLTIAGSSYFVGRGWVTGEEFQTAIGAITAIGGLAWSVWSRNTSKMITDTQKLPQVSKVLKH